MPTSLRRLVLAAVLLPLFVSTAAAQTVIVTKAPPQDKVEVIAGGKTAGTATVDGRGVATIPIKLQAAAGTQGMDARVYVDVCPQLHRVLIVERNQIPGNKDEGCDRREIPGIFWIRPANTLVLGVGGAIPTLLLVKGKYDVDNPSPVRRAATGFIVFGGGGLIGFDNVAAAACGDVSDCRQDGSGALLSGGVAYWLRPWLAAEASYNRPSKLTTAGGASDFDFTTTFDVHIFNVLANVGIPARGMRIYGKIGANFHSATTTTRQVEGELSQTMALETQGWGPVYGGGFEGWIKPRFGIYAEGMFGSLKGEPTERGVEGDMDDGFQYFVVGVRVKLF